MNDEQEAGGERNSYGCSAADYDIHSYKYNRVLFHNMMGFMDLCLEIRSEEHTSELQSPQ